MNSPIKWIGGKRNLRKDLVKLMPDHMQYCEVFAGALWVMLEKEPSKLEIINDINGDLINFYRVIQDQHKCQEMIDKLYFLPKSREIFEQFDYALEQERNCISDVDRAVMFYYLLKLCFGGRVDRRKKSFCIPNDGRKQINYEKFPEEFLYLHQRLQNVFIERTDYKYILDKYDRKDGLFYLDPPYLDSTETIYAVNFNLNEYKQMKDLLKKLKGKFILTCNDSRELRELFEDFNILSKDVFYSVAPRKQRNFKELIVTNF